MGLSPDAADGRLLQKVWNLRSELLPLFVAVFEAKRYFEKYVGTQYTSSLYFAPPESNPSLTLYFVEQSAYDGLDNQIESIRSGKTLEDKWKNIVHNIWQGSCYSTALMGMEKVQVRLYLICLVLNHFSFYQDAKKI